MPATPSPQNVEDPPPLPPVTAHLSDAQMSRVAAQTVRLSIREGEFGDALYVVNSACHSVLRNPLQPEETRDSAPLARLQPIAFGRPVSPRLAAHAFLHGLVRRGYTLKAQKYATLMIRVGIPIQRRTLEEIVRTLNSPASALPRFGPFSRVIPRTRVRNSQPVLQLQTGMVADGCARATLELLQTARQFGQQRTERMYRVLISTLLMQGEIIVASLLFVILLKDWELRTLQERATRDEPMLDRLSHEHLGVPPPSQAALLAVPYPDLQIMSNVLDAIDAKFAKVSDHQSDPTLLPYLQSLAVLAMLLDTGQLHTHRVASIIRTLYNCPKTRAHVWILRDGQLVSVRAYPYFHQVLQRLVDSLAENSERTPPKLSRRAYNSLLTYSLRHRFSPTMASQVLNHMCVYRTPPIQPDIVTYNILMRSGTLLRQTHISRIALTALRTESSALGLATTPFEGLTPMEDGHTRKPTSRAMGELPPSDFAAALMQLESERLVLQQAVSAPSDEPKPNPSTLTSFITHLTATGRPHDITSILFELLPELWSIDHPATNGVAVPPAFKVSRREAIRRAAAHGPYLFAALINALAKAGEVGLAERVFILAQQAERATHTPGFVKNVAPWRLSVEAYTSMMQSYARVVHERLPTFKRSKYHLGSALLTWDSAWQPKARHYRQGYARYVYLANNLSARRRARSLTKRQVSKHNAMLLYRSMMSGGRALLANMIASNASPTKSSTRKPARVGEPAWFVLLPDERFFNAALKLFAPISRRSKRPRPRFQDRRKHKKMAGMEDKSASQGWNPMLHQLVTAIAASGHRVPERYQYMLRGRLRKQRKNPRSSAVCRPYAFPSVTRRTRSDFLPTLKSRGLPLRRRKKRPSGYMAEETAD
ncbi:hypothetical protein C8Q80DRAFT_1119068 [Daedaleopsis nitida]|nr:hypothetical protein C8Q80DRAFT_1119068 [Daedaleopsis nitida]